MNTTMSNMPVSVSSNPVTAKMVAERLGLSVYTIYSCLNKKSIHHAQKTVELVRQTAADMGYDPKAAAHSKESRKKAVKTTWLRHSNFETRELETQRMEELRAQGYSSAEIARKIGRAYGTVLKRIGKQADDMSFANRIQGQKNRAVRNAQRRQYVADHTVSTYNNVVTELAEVRNRLVKLEDQVVEMKPLAIAAAKVSKVKMITDISAVSSTAIQ